MARNEIKFVTIINSNTSVTGNFFWIKIGRHDEFTGGACLNNNWTRTININAKTIGINFISKGWLNTIRVVINDFGAFKSFFDGLGAGFDGKRL